MRIAPFLVAGTLVLALAGCVPSGGHGTASPSASASATPVFSSDEEALKAAEAAYAAYVKVSDQIANDGGKDPGRFAAVVTKDWLPTEFSSASTLEQSGRHQTGATAFSNLQLQQRSQDGNGANLVVYTCLDLSGTRILDAADHDVTPLSRQPKVSIEVSFKSDPRMLSHLLVDKNEPWPGHTFC